MIKLSKKGSYALKAVIYIAERYPKLIKILDISKDLEISESLLRRIISELEKSGVLITTKGRFGGVELGMDIENISFYDILNSVGEELNIRDCTKGIICDNVERCSITNIFGDLQKSFNGILKLYTLDKVIKK
ncbi:MAG: Rrf2 family transcriptional regulator [Candidatus Gracilibacteria bacterium]|nr:Rrf2 family transcriptional regulator [Candidatus Gracilibacteria bacterium]